MAIGVKYDDGSGSLKPLASYKGMFSPWGTSKHGLFGNAPAKSATIGVKYDDGSGSLKPLASYKGMRSPRGTSTKGMFSPWGTSKHGLFGNAPAKSAARDPSRGKSLVEKMKERRDEKKREFRKESLDEVDKRRGGVVIGGASPHSFDADDASRGSEGHDPWERYYLTGIHVQREAPTGRNVVWAYVRSDKFTGEGRCFETSGETRIPVFSFFDSQSEDKGCFRIVVGEEGEISFENCYVQIAGKLYEVIPSSYGETELYGKFLSVKADVHSPSGETTFSMQTYESFSELNEEQDDPDYLVIPLYKFGEDGDVECDFRSVPYEWQMNYGKGNQ